MAKISAPAARAIAIAACPTPPVAEWISTLSPEVIRASSCRPCHAVACAVATAAASCSASPVGRVVARLASQVTNVPQQPLADTPPTRSPTLVSRHARPDRGDHAGEVRAQLRQAPVEARVAAEGDQDVGEVDARRGHRDLDLARPRRDPVERNEFQRFQVTGRADLQAHAVVLVVDALRCAVRRRAAGPGTAARCTTGRRARRSRPRRTRSAAGAPAARPSVASSTSIWVARSRGCSMPITRTRPRSPACSRFEYVVGHNGLRVPGHHVEPRRLAGRLGQLAGDAHQMAYTVTAAQPRFAVRCRLGRRGQRRPRRSAPARAR